MPGRATSPSQAPEETSTRAGAGHVPVRSPHLRHLEELARHTEAPIVNARTAHNHPCEILGDLAFANAAGHPVDEPLQVVFVGATTNLYRSWCEAAEALPIAITHACPEGYDDADALVGIAGASSPRGTVPPPAG